MTPTAVLALVVSGSISARPAAGHDIDVPLLELRQDTDRLAETLRFYRARPPTGKRIESVDDQRRLLGTAEIELALGHQDRALEILIGRLADSRFAALPNYVDTLLLTSEILESRAEDAGAMMYAELALRRGGPPKAMAEAGARWFRVARRAQRSDRRAEIYDLWRQQGGEAAAPGEDASQARYEVAFSLRDRGRYGDALRLLQGVPSDSAFGSRAAYLAAVVFVEGGNLAQAERWFSAIMKWALPNLDPDHPQMKIERQVRHLAALSTGRLRFERADLDGAAAAYEQIPPESTFGGEACWERAYLDLARNKQRGALKEFQCVVDLGARGQRVFQARLFKASLLAHLERYNESIRSYEALHTSLRGQHALFKEAAAGIGRPASFLFEAMERSASRTPNPDPPSPGPDTLMADAWTADVDRAYRIDRGARTSQGAVQAILTSIRTIEDAVRSNRAFVGFKVRRQHLELLLGEVRHLEGHAGTAARATRMAHQGGDDASGHDHVGVQRAMTATIQRLRALGRDVESDLSVLTTDETQRRQAALRQLESLKTDVYAIGSDLTQLQKASTDPLDRAASGAIEQVEEALRDAAMRAEIGVLDTFWLKKQHRTRAVEKLLQEQHESDRQLDEALDSRP